MRLSPEQAELSNFFTAVQLGSPVNIINFEGHQNPKNHDVRRNLKAVRD